MNGNFVVVDTETGGLIPSRHSLLEVALLAYRGGEIIDRKEFFIKEAEYTVTPKAMEINGLDISKVAEQGVLPRVAIDMIQNFVEKNFPGEEPPMMMGHNVGFDRDFLKYLFLRFDKNIDAVLSYRVLDTTSIIRVAKLLGKLPLDAPESLHKLAEYFGFYPIRPHAAMCDAETTVQVFEKLMEALKEEDSPWGLKENALETV